MAAWLQRDVEGGASRRLTGSSESVHLRVCLAEFLMPAFAEDLVVTHDHRADQRVGLDMAAPLLGKFERAAHPDFSGSIHGDYFRNYLNTSPERRF